MDREAYFRAAYQILETRGHAAVTVNAMCESLHVTKGSFYKRFTGFDDFVGAFAERWVKAAGAYLGTLVAAPDIRRRLEVIANGHLYFQLGAEPAIRVWAGTRPALAENLFRLHLQAQEEGAAVFAEVLGDTTSGADVAATVIAVHVGLAHGCRPVKLEQLLLVEQHLYAALLGIRSRIVRSPRGGHLLLEIEEWRRGNPALHPSPATRPRRAPNAGVSSGAGCRLADGADRSTERFPDAARRLLARSGPSGISVAALSEELGLSKGAFQHRYGTLANFERDFAEGLASHSYCATTTDPPAQALADVLFELFLCDSHPEAAALREWAHSNAGVRTGVDRMDDAHKNCLTAMLRESVDLGAAEAMADITYALAVGLRQRGPRLEKTTVARILELWIDCVLTIPCRVDSTALGLRFTISPRRGRTTRRAPDLPEGLSATTSAYDRYEI
ncbi:MAG: TetR/AcrR family transcriptional regulator [Sporichthyaceae bacterium]